VAFAYRDSTNLWQFTSISRRKVMIKRWTGVVLVSLMLCSLVFAAGPKSYQVTGPVLDIKGDVVTVQKGTEKWEITVDKTAKVTGELKVGAKVTIEYQMKAVAVEVKPETAKTAPAAKTPAAKK
jgi:hypothetical protein